MSKKLVLNPLTGQFDFVDQVTATAVGSAPNSAGVSISTDNAVTLQPADASNPGIISTGAQAIPGSKTFSSVTYTDGGIDLSTSGTLSLGTSANATTINIGHSGATVNILGTTLYENVSELAVTDPLITINKSGAAGSGANSGIEINENNVITGYAETSADRNSWILKAPNTSGVATITPGASGITLAGSITGGTTSGTNTGDQTITLTSDVTGTGTGSFATTIAANAVTNAKAAQMSANTLKGNNTGSTANASDLTVSQAQTLLSVPTSSAPLALNAGGTGTSAASAGAALNALLPSQSGNASKVLKTDGTNAAWAFSSPVTQVKHQVFTSSGTYTPTSGMVYCVVEIVGGGGGGGGVLGDASKAAAAGGGGGGAYTRKAFSAATIGASQTVTIGALGTGGAVGTNNGTAGGSSSFGSLLVVGGGGGGVSPAPATGFNVGGGGTGGAVSTAGDFSANGELGSAGTSNATAVVLSSARGGSTYFGGGGGFIPNQAGQVATAWGAGGGGASQVINPTGSAGGNGAGGVCLITEYISS